MFIEERLLDSVSYGTVYGERFRTSIQTMRNKSESRNMEWSESEGEYTLVFDALLEKDRAKVMEVFRTCRGRGIGFRLKNWVDYKVKDEVIGVTTESPQTLQLKLTSTLGGYSTTKTIRKPVVDTVTIKVDGVPSGASIDYTKGLVSVTAPIGSTISWDGEYDIPVRFASDDIHWSVDARTGDRFIMGTDVELQEVYND